MTSLVLPSVDVAMEAGKLLETVPALWEQADLSERRRILMTMLDAVYVDTKEEKRIVAVEPKPAFRPIFQVATTREGSEVMLIKEPPEDSQEASVTSPCSWRSWGRLERYLNHRLAIVLAVRSIGLTSNCPVEPYGEISGCCAPRQSALSLGRWTQGPNELRQ